jgi:hypothetical protein
MASFMDGGHAAGADRQPFLHISTAVLETIQLVLAALQPF